MAGELDFGAEPIVRVAGNDLPPAIKPNLEEVVIDDATHLPDMCEIRFRDPAHDTFTRLGAEVGVELEVAATPAGRTGDAAPIFRGEITALEVVYEQATGSHAVIRAYDQSHRLLKHRRVQAFEQLSVVDIVQQIAGDAGVTVGTLDGSRDPLDHVAQFNQTDMDFLQQLARDSGSELTVELGELHLRPPPPSSDAPGEGDLRRQNEPLQLTVGQNLRSVHTRMSAANQCEQVVVRGWDPWRKEAIEASSPAETTSVDIGTSPRELAQAFDVSEERFVHRPFETQAQVDAAADAIAEAVASAHVECYGIADGNPALRAGEPLSIALLGDPFDGKYTVTSARHVFDEAGYRTQFEVTGRQERSVYGLTGGAAGGAAPSGAVIATVSNVRDPDNRGRVRLRYPWLDDTFESWWVRIAQADAGADGRGTLFLPEVGDEVLVVFERGDVNKPFVIGGLWNGVDLPPDADSAVDGTSGAVARREIRSQLGHRIVLGDDSSAASGILLSSADENYSLDLSESDRRFLLTVGSSSIEVTDAGDVVITAANDLRLSGVNVTIEASAALELTGATAKVEASGPTEIKGAVVQLN